jgi:hypothetical protein
MTRTDLERLERQLEPLVVVEGATASARGDAQRFNAEASDVRSALLEPSLGLLASGGVRPELASCLARTVAELAFWRRVLLRVHEAAFAAGAAAPDFLVSYLRS